MVRTESIDQESFENLISARMAGEPVSTDEITLTAGDSRLGIRLVGAPITECVVGGVPILIAPPQEQLPNPNLMASHAVASAGGSGNTNGQHDPFRWTDYTLGDYPDSPYGYKGEKRVSITAQVPPEHPGLTRTFRLAPDNVKIITTLSNPPKASEPLTTSLSERLYVAAGGGNLRDLRIRDETIDQLLGQPGALAAIEDGGERFWNGYGLAYVKFPQKDRLRFVGRMTCKEMSYAQDEQAYDSLGMLLSQRERAIGGLCMEPIIGMRQTEDGSLKKDQLVIPPGASVSLHTEMSLLHH